MSIDKWLCCFGLTEFYIWVRSANFHLAFSKQTMIEVSSQSICIYEAHEYLSLVMFAWSVS